MRSPSPFLDNNKTEAALLSRPDLLFRPLADGLYGKYSIRDPYGRVIYETDFMPISSAKSFIINTLLNVSPTALYPVWITVFWKRGSRSDVWSKKLMSYRPKRPRVLSRTRRILFYIKIPRQAFGAAMRKARSVLGSRIKSSHPTRNWSKPSSSLRPNPESTTTTMQRWSEGNNGGYFLTPTPPFTYTSYTRQWGGVRTPNWGKLKASTEMPINNHFVRIDTVKEGRYTSMNADLSSPNGIYFNRFANHTETFVAPHYTGHNPTVRNKAITRLIDECDASLEANLAQDIAQIGQLVNLIAGTAKRVSSAALNLKKGNLLGAANMLFGHGPRKFGRGGPPSKLKTLANNWLALQYGWKPLLQDLHGSMEAFGKFMLNNSSIVAVKASASVKSFTVVNEKSGSDIVGWTSTDQTSFTKFGVRFSIDSHLKAFLAQTGFTNPLNLAWEILPFSFVADWFLPIGPYLESLSAFDGLHFVDGYEVNFSRWNGKSAINFQGNPKGSPNPKQLVTLKSSYFAETVHFERARMLSWPRKSPPILKNGLSVTHAVNALALVKATFK